MGMTCYLVVTRLKIDKKTVLCPFQGSIDNRLTYLMIFSNYHGKNLLRYSEESFVDNNPLVKLQVMKFATDSTICRIPNMVLNVK